MDAHTAAACRRIEWMIVRYLYPTPEREAPPPTDGNPYHDHPDQLVTRSPYLT